MAEMRVLVDTNLFVSHLLHPRDPDRSTYRLVQTLLERRVTHVVPAQLLEELERAVLASRYLQERISPEQLREFRKSLLEISEVVTLMDTPIIPVLRDPKDDYLLTTAWKFSIDLLIAGDRDLLEMRDRIGPPRIVTVAEFLESRYP